MEECLNYKYLDFCLDPSHARLIWHGARVDVSLSNYAWKELRCFVGSLKARGEYARLPKNHCCVSMVNKKLILTRKDSKGEILETQINSVDEAKLIIQMTKLVPWDRGKTILFCQKTDEAAKLG